MTAFRIIPTVKLFNQAKKARSDGYGSNSVYITVRTKGSHELVDDWWGGMNEIMLEEAKTSN